MLLDICVGEVIAAAKKIGAHGSFVSHKCKDSALRDLSTFVIIFKNLGRSERQGHGKVLAVTNTTYTRNWLRSVI